jgi:hypothetical protein
MGHPDVCYLQSAGDPRTESVGIPAGSHLFRIGNELLLKFQALSPKRQAHIKQLLDKNTLWSLHAVLSWE